MLSLELVVDYPDSKTAEAVMKALDPDNGGYVKSVMSGNVITFSIEASNAGTMRNTADDLMACLKTAEEAIGITASH